MVDFKYIKIISRLLEQPEIDGTRELLNYRFFIDPKDNIIKYRDISLSYILAEMIWYFSGKNDVQFISQFASIWSKLTDDGITNNSAYGYILKHKFDFDQIEKVIELLKTHRESRRAVININTPNRNVIQTKDEPCTIALQFYIRNNSLNATGIMRSNDVWFGLPYDIIFFTELQKYIARRLNVHVGIYTHFAVSLHMYLRDEEKLKNVLENYKLGNRKNYKIDFEKLIDQSKELYHLVDKENIIKIAEERKIVL
jgi:thymidylate synthase